MTSPRYLSPPALARQLGVDAAKIRVDSLRRVGSSRHGNSRWRSATLADLAGGDSGVPETAAIAAGGTCTTPAATAKNIICSARIFLTPDKRQSSVRKVPASGDWKTK